jgi:hypothetical protein
MGSDKGLDSYGILLYIIFVLSCIYGVVMRLYGIFEPLVVLGSGLVSPSSGFNNAVYSLSARNFLRYGYIDLGFGQVLNVGHVQPESFSYYVTHPPLSSILTSLSFRIFGISEWSVQIIPFMLSIGCLILFYELLKTYFTREVTILSFCVFAVSPLSVLFIGHVLDVEQSIHMFFSLVLLFSYFAWVRTKNDKVYLPLVIVSLLLGSISNWPIYLLFGLLLLDYILFVERKALASMIFGGMLIGMIVGGVFYAFVYMPSRTPDPIMVGSHSILDVALGYMRASTLSEAVVLLLKRIWAFCTPITLVFIIIGGVGSLRRVIGNLRCISHRILCVLAIWPFLWILPFTGHFKGNIHLVYLAAPIVSLLAGLGLSTCLVSFQRRKAKWMGLLALSGIAYVVVSASFYVTIREYDYGKDISYAIKTFGTDIQQQSGIRETVLIPNEYSWQLKFYADRQGYGGMNSPEVVKDLAGTGENALYFMPFQIVFEDSGVVDYVVSAYRGEVLKSSIRFDLNEQIEIDDGSRMAHEIMLHDGGSVFVESRLFQGKTATARLVCWDGNSRPSSAGERSGISRFIQIVDAHSGALRNEYALFDQHGQSKRCVVVADVPGGTPVIRVIERVSENARIDFAMRNFKRLLRYGTFGILGREVFVDTELGSGGLS